MQEMALFFPLARSESDKTYSHSPIIPHKDHSDWSEGVDFLQAKVLQVNINMLFKKKNLYKRYRFYSNSSSTGIVRQTLIR